MRGKDTPSDRQKTLKMSLFKPSWGLALTSPKEQETGGLATPFCGSHLAGHLSQDCFPQLDKGREKTSPFFGGHSG